MTSLFLVSCFNRSGVDDIEPANELAQHVMDFISTVDDINLGQSSFAFRPSNIDFKNFSFLQPFTVAQCSGISFTTCQSGTATKTYEQCQQGTKLLQGSLSLNWTGGTSSTACSFGTTTGSSVNMTTQYSVTRDDGVQAQVSTTDSNGLSLIWILGTGFVGDPKIYEYSSSGLKRQISYNGFTYYNRTIITDTNVQINGENRLNRIISGGPIYITDHFKNDHCDMSFDDITQLVTWDSTCNCPITGEASGQCAKTGAVKLKITGCGTGQVTYNLKTSSVIFEKCHAM